MSKPRSEGGVGAEVEEILDLDGLDQLGLFGPGDANLHFLETKSGGTLVARGDRMVIRGTVEMVPLVREVLLDLIERVGRGQMVDSVSLRYLWESRAGKRAPDPGLIQGDDPLLFASGSRQAVRVKTRGQQAYVKAVHDHDVVFSIGPAGTGKTFLAVVMALDYLKRQLVDRIVLVRPAVEAGEQLGFLPGDLQEKINPYMRPLFDALSDVTGAAKIARFMSSGVIEASPLAYMRGRTLNNSFVILDEAQNTTLGQMKMFLTRLGVQSKAVVTGDVTQVDLPDKRRSGLVLVRDILRDTEGVAFVELDGRDVVRHPLVRRIVDAFDAAGVAKDGV